MGQAFDSQFQAMHDAFARQGVYIEVAYAPNGRADYLYQAGRLLAAAAGRDLPDLLVNPIARETDGNPSLILEALLLLAQEGIDGLTG